MPEAPPAIGVDLGATKITTAIVEAAGRIVASETIPTHADRGPEAVIDDIVASARRCAEQAGRAPCAVGIGVAGQVSSAAGSVLYAPNLRWRNVPFRDKIEAALQVPVFVTNDVRAATWGEWVHGAGKGADPLVCLFVGTGVGGGIVAGGRLLTGHTDGAGELGHIVVVAGGRECHCPNRGCLEAYVGGWAIAERAQQAAREHMDGAAAMLSVAGTVSAIGASTVTRAFREGDRLAARLVDETGEYLGVGVTSIVNAINPEKIILGGGVIGHLPELIDRAKQVVFKQALGASVSELKIARAQLGSEAGVVGAAAWAHHTGKTELEES